MWAAVFLPALMGALATAMASLVGRAFLAIGIGFVTYSGITFAIDKMKSDVMAGINALPSDTLGLIAYLWLDKGITVIFSAVAASLAMRALGGSVKRMTFK